MSEHQYPNILPPNRVKEYKRCPSLIDHENKQSLLNRTKFRGFFNMALIFGFVFIFTKPIVSKIQNGYFLEPSLYTRFMTDYILCLLIWPLFFLWSFTSYFIQKLILKGISPITVLILQHSTQAGLFIFSTGLILMKDWCTTHSAFVIIQAVAHFMKMHSYTTVNRDYRQEYLQATKCNRSARTSYPDNITVKDFVLFMWTPWIVYDVYPRKQTRSLAYIMKKSFLCLMFVLSAYIISTEYVMPPIEMGSKLSFFQLLFMEMLPTTMLLLVVFYVTFQNITNIFAQITKLDHREYYEDWWNSTTYEQFNRKWNKPVHLFLYRHLYLELLIRWKCSKARAQVITFMFSALLHEFLLAIICRIIRPIFLGFIIGQVPLIYLTKWMEGKKSGRYLFWFGLFTGPALILTCYLRVSDSVTELFTRA